MSSLKKARESCINMSCRRFTFHTFFYPHPLFSTASKACFPSQYENIFFLSDYLVVPSLGSYVQPMSRSNADVQQTYNFKQVPSRAAQFGMPLPRKELRAQGCELAQSQNAIDISCYEKVAATMKIHLSCRRSL